MSSLGKSLIVAGLAIALIGVFIAFAARVPFLGKLPGDIAFKRGHFSFYFPLTTFILISVLINLICDCSIAGDGGGKSLTSNAPSPSPLLAVGLSLSRISAGEGGATLCGAAGEGRLTILRIALTVIVLAGVSHSAWSEPWFSGASSAARSTEAGVDRPSVQLLDPLPSTVRVCLMHARKAVKLGCTGPYDYVLLAGGKVLSSSAVQQVRPERRHAVIIGNTRFLGDVIIAPVRTHDYLTLNGRRYRGALLFEPAIEAKFDVIEQLDFEEYLYGVLPREMGPNWPLEALKAQAVASRTYALANRSSGGRYDVAADVSSQVYGGMEDESAAATKAVEDTRGQVLVDKRGKAIQAFFHSSCGGRTETASHVWKASDEWDYFSSVQDPYCKDDPFIHWQLTIKASTLKAKLTKAGVHVGDIRKIKADERSPSDRVSQFLVVGTRGKTKVQGNRFRLAVGPEALRSTLLTEISKSGERFHFEGRGWGHGIGLCQYGARGRSEAGMRYEQILNAYYPLAYLVRGRIG